MGIVTEQFLENNAYSNGICRTQLSNYQKTSVEILYIVREVAVSEKCSV